MEVAKSLQARDHISIPHGLLLWLRYMLEIITQTKNAQRHFIAFDELLTRPEEYFRELRLPKPFPKAEAEQFISRDLRNHEKTNEPIATPWVIELYQMLPNIDETRVAEIRNGLFSILEPVTELCIAKGKAEHELRAQLKQKRKWLP